MKLYKEKLFLFLVCVLLIRFPSGIEAFCGFYVAKADASLYNKVSRVVMIRDANRTVIGMMNDYKGELEKFALVVPVPTVLTKQQIHIGDSKVFDHLDVYTAPRLVEYFDPDPCLLQPKRSKYKYDLQMESLPPIPQSPKSQKPLGVKIEASYTIGEYDIVILSAEYSDGLETWLLQNGYKIPAGASSALKPYIKQKMKFFVAKVNLKKHNSTGLTYLRPIQFAFESEKFMLPIRLGMINSKGSQELLLYILTKNGRVETTNYRSAKLPTGMEIPEYVKGEFGSFYKSMFEHQTKKENSRVVFTEYFWDMSWCDPCAADPLSRDELKSLGVFWLNDSINPNFSFRSPPRVMVTRLHVSYNAQNFPEDLLFQETNDTNNFQGRYVLQHPWNGKHNKCSEAKEYFKRLVERKEKRAYNLAELTGWNIDGIRTKMNLHPLENDNGNERGGNWWTPWQ
ncbi:MAG: DUF2330 domain-containing protein [Leptospiraceae bacterium]|nr:DUF2330 domain-containing protein [Leptospiraceae bacterium]MCP5496613.1 DUF2330 domain-containing protein [Leptospiraceae bacterium]